MSNKTIHSFWISGKLQPINILTIRSFQKHGHNFVLYCYDTEDVQSDIAKYPKCYLGANAGTLEIRNANSILSEDAIFYYKNMQGGNPNFKFGGIAERLKAEMLYQLGGWHVDLDVTCLRTFDFESDFVFRPHEKGVVGNIIKAPAFSELARRYVEHTKTIDENNVVWERSFMGLNKIVKDLNLQHFIVKKSALGDDSREYWERFLKNGESPEPELHAIHWCNAMQKQAEPNSFYIQLLKQYNLI